MLDRLIGAVSSFRGYTIFTARSDSAEAIRRPAWGQEVIVEHQTDSSWDQTSDPPTSERVCSKLEPALRVADFTTYGTVSKRGNSETGSDRHLLTLTSAVHSYISHNCHCPSATTNRSFSVVRLLLPLDCHYASTRP